MKFRKEEFKTGVHFKDAVSGRKLESLSANELRLKLYNSGHGDKIPSVCGKQTLIDLVRKYG